MPLNAIVTSVLRLCWFPNAMPVNAHELCWFHKIAQSTCWDAFIKIDSGIVTYHIHVTLLSQ